MIEYNAIIQNHLPDISDLIGAERMEILETGNNFIILDITNEFSLYEKACSDLTVNYKNSLSLFKLLCEYYIVSTGPEIVITEELAAEAEYYADAHFNDEESVIKNECLYDRIFELIRPITNMLYNISLRFKQYNITKEDTMPYYWDIRIPNKDSLDRLVVNLVCVYKR